MKRRTLFLTYLVAISAVMAVLLSLSTQAVRVTADGEDDTQVRPTPRPVPPRRSSSVTRYISRVRVEGPYHESGLTVFTLTTRRPETGVNYLTLDEGVASGQLILREKGGGSVPALQIHNISGRWAFLMNGELLAGGKQNRTVRTDVLIPPNATVWVDLPVYCVEQHRWSRGGKFGSGNNFAPNSVRAGLNQGYDQGAVWRRVAEVSKAAKVKSRTGDVTVIYNDAKSKKRIDEITSKLCRRIPRRQYVGLVVARGRDIVSADLFANTQLYAKLYEKVIRSHAAEVLYRRYTGRPTVGEVQAFLNRIHGARQTQRPAPNGYGTLITISGNRLGGQALEYGGRCLHAALFPQIVRPMPMPVPRPMPRPHPPRR